MQQKASLQPKNSEIIALSKSNSKLASKISSLAPNLELKIREVFSKMDQDGNQVIDKQEFIINYKKSAENITHMQRLALYIYDK